MPTPSSSIHSLMAGLVDYAGLFPPAGLDMETAVRNYAAYLAGAESWMLGRFVVPAARLGEFERAGAGLLPTGPEDPPWQLSALIGEDIDADLARIAAFNAVHSDAPAPGEEAAGDGAPAAGAGDAIIDAVELKASSAAAIDAAIEKIPDNLFPHFEIPVTGDPRGLIAALAGGDAAAKIRTGGVTADVFPTSEQVARFMLACAGARVPFKATAGLHHALRAEHRLTYEPDAPTGVMHGFLNLFLGAAMADSEAVGERDLVALLEERSASAFRFDDNGVVWRGERLDTIRIALARERFAISFGSCSFEEPLQDLRTLGLL